MNILFVHGMGRTPLSGAPMLWRLRHQGHATSTFGYWTALESFQTIRDRLGIRIARLAGRGAYALVGHSLGGVLLRSALETLPAAMRQPARVFLLGSPITSSLRARQLRKRFLFRLLAGDCGQLLASAERMAAIGPLAAPSTSIVGTLGLRGRWSPFQGEPNDGIVAVGEAAAPWLTEELRVPVIHTLLPASRLVSDLLAGRL